MMRDQYNSLELCANDVWNKYPEAFGVSYKNKDCWRHDDMTIPLGKTEDTFDACQFDGKCPKGYHSCHSCCELSEDDLCKCDVGKGALPKRPSCMVPACKNCSLKGKQALKGGYTILAKCQLECRKDPTCFGISFGKGQTSNWNRCFFFYERDAITADTGNDKNFDTWRKSYDCFETVSFEKECTDCAECKFDGNIKWALGGSGHTQEQCLEACRQNQDCMYASISTDGYCHMMPTCSSNDGSGWTRFKRTSENPFDPKRAHQCATEWNECTCDGSVIFGLDAKWSEPKEANGKIMCSKDLFGDPAPGLHKKCLCTPRNVASGVATSDGHLWSSNVETIFRYKSNDLASMIHDRRQLSSHLNIQLPVHLVADVKVQAFSDKTIRVKLEHINFLSNNNEITMIEAHRVIDMISPQNGGAVHGAQAFKTSMEEPIMILVKQGKAKKIIVAQNEPDCVSKVKMALVSHLMRTGLNPNLQVVKKQAIITPIEVASQAKTLDVNL